MSVAEHCFTKKGLASRMISTCQPVVHQQLRAQNISTQPNRFSITVFELRAEGVFVQADNRRLPTAVVNRQYVKSDRAFRNVPFC